MTDRAPPNAATQKLLDALIEVAADHDTQTVLAAAVNLAAAAIVEMAKDGKWKKQQALKLAGEISDEVRLMVEANWDQPKAH